ncbi:hypothetical protein EW146_g4067 [Bondarzewia mesenterica]|uniref:Uncharacterized protein n=1 Tax=Bondarzewia mesenterica TaxID=1095465 RepID=A0A4S4LVM2_9AGAM|nr:hypothetical protein EW146_g4067 [Bondarzewia mesenterica]
MEFTLRPCPPLPRTPSSKGYHHIHTPHTSSPLTDSLLSSPSPTSTAHARRRSQYKSTAPAPPSSSPRQRRKISHAYKTRAFDVRTRLFGASGEIEEEPPRNVLLRERFKARCLERAIKAREAKVKHGRAGCTSGPSSDGDFDDGMDMDDDEDDDDDDDFMLNDELFRRIMASANRKRQHQYRVSYQLDVGSSFDPDMEDVGEWERQLGVFAHAPSCLVSSSLPHPTPDLDNEEEAAALAQYAEECELLEDLEAHADEIFSLSDLDDVDLDEGALRKADQDVEMA